MPGTAATWYRAAALLVLGVSIATAHADDGLTRPRGPRLDVVAPPSLAAQAARLADLDAQRLAALMRLVGLDDPGPPIRVHLVPEFAPLAAATPDWIAGFAHDDQVVIFPQRSPSYPHESLQQVLEHEVGHVLIDRAAGGGRVPRWFHEGLAMAAERNWSLGDQAHHVSDIAFGGAVPVHDLDALFAAGPAGASRAYRLSDALLRDLLEQHGPDLPARLLAAMRSGYSFDRAFQQATGATVAAAGEAYWNRRWLWVSWLPWVTSPGVLYSAITVMALLAAWRVYVKRRARRHGDDEGLPDADLPRSDRFGTERRQSEGGSSGPPWVH